MHVAVVHEVLDLKDLLVIRHAMVVHRPQSPARAQNLRMKIQTSLTVFSSDVCCSQIALARRAPFDTPTRAAHNMTDMQSKTLQKRSMFPTTVASQPRHAEELISSVSKRKLETTGP